jgi:hypothetical protein
MTFLLSICFLCSLDWVDLNVLADLTCFFSRSFRVIGAEIPSSRCFYVYYLYHAVLMLLLTGDSC